jgi:ankyrin repeat protein
MKIQTITTRFSILIIFLGVSLNVLAYDRMAKTQSSPNDVYSFVYLWFSGFDHQEKSSYFTKHIAEPVDMEFPGKSINSYKDFEDWYRWVQNNIEWNSHAIKQLQVSGNDVEGWKASYNVLWKAKDKADKYIKMLVHQELDIKKIDGVLKITKHRATVRDVDNQDTHRNALMKAAGIGDIIQVKSLIESGANIFEIDPITGSSVVHFAAQGGNVEVMKYLVANGAEAIINLQAASNSFTPLMWATWYQNPEMVKYLLSLPHINANLKDQFGRRASDFPVVAKGYTKLAVKDSELKKIFKQYYENYEKYMSLKFEVDRTTPKNLPADVNLVIPNNEIGNGFHSAALSAGRDNNLELFEKMIANGADLTVEGEYMKAIVAHKAAYMGNPEIMKLIVSHKDFDKIKNAQGPTNGYTPLHDAIWHGHTQTAKILIEAGVDTSIKAWDGLTPLDLAKKHNFIEIVTLLENK